MPDSEGPSASGSGGNGRDSNVGHLTLAIPRLADEDGR